MTKRKTHKRSMKDHRVGDIVRSTYSRRRWYGRVVEVGEYEYPPMYRGTPWVKVESICTDKGRRHRRIFTVQRHPAWFRPATLPEDIKPAW